MLRYGKALWLCIVIITLGCIVNTVAAGQAADPDLLGPPAKAQRVDPDQDVLAAFDELEAYIGDLPIDVLNKGRRQSFLAKLNNAEAAYRRGQPCTAANILGAYLNAAQALRKHDTTEIAEDLSNRGRALLDLLLQRLPDEVRCAGYVSNPVEPTLDVTASDNQVFKATVRFGTPRMWSVHAGGELFTQLQVPGVSLGNGEPGWPDVPVYRSLIAVPRGAEASIVGRPLARDSVFINLYPNQPQPEDQVATDIEEPDPETFENKPFEKNDEVYATAAFLPDDVCTTRYLGSMRDIQVGEIACATGRYNPVTDELVLFDGVEFEVAFNGGRGAFVTTAALSPFDQTRRMVEGRVANSDILFEYVEDRLTPVLDIGEELLILTHPDFKEAADRLADWKNQKGIMTQVFVVNDGDDGPAPDTANQIEAFINDRFFHSLIPPSYVLLLGDAEFIPTFYVYSTARGDLGSDHPYATIIDISSDPDYLIADMAIARMPVDTLGQANVAVDKVIDYEHSPPSNSAFYNHATMASQFQCCRTDVITDGTAQRTFTEVSEWTRNVLMNHGYTVDRIYEKTVDSDYSDLGRWELPLFYFDGTPLPSDLGAFSGFPWDGSTQDIADAFNAGRFFILHRDHGGSQGWSHPRFNINHVANLTNGDLLPVVLSVNCATGLFDDESIPGATEALRMAESLIRKSGGGAVGVLADTRNSPSWPNTYLTMGFVDAIWPDAISNFGPAASNRRLADILILGKLYLWNHDGFNVDTIDETTMWHAFGDPTLEIWTSQPLVISLAGFDLTYVSGGMAIRSDLEGAELTVYQPVKNGGQLPIGRARVVDGEAFVEYFNQPVAGIPTYISASLENAISTRVMADASSVGN